MIIKFSKKRARCLTEADTAREAIPKSNSRREEVLEAMGFLAPILWPAALATSPKLGRLQKISIAFLAPIPWLAPLVLATFPKLGRLQKNFNRISRAHIVTRGTRNISKAWSTSKNFNRISRANIVTSGTRNISKAWSTSKNFNRISRANIVTSGTRNISKAWSTSKNFHSHFSRQYRD